MSNIVRITRCLLRLPAGSPGKATASDSSKDRHLKVEPRLSALGSRLPGSSSPILPYGAPPVKVAFVILRVTICYCVQALRKLFAVTSKQQKSYEARRLWLRNHRPHLRTQSPTARNVATTAPTTQYPIGARTAQDWEHTLL